MLQRAVDIVNYDLLCTEYTAMTKSDEGKAELAALAKTLHQADVPLDQWARMQEAPFVLPETPEGWTGYAVDPYLVAEWKKLADSNPIRRGFALHGHCLARLDVAVHYMLKLVDMLQVGLFVRFRFIFCGFVCCSCVCFVSFRFVCFVSFVWLETFLLLLLLLLEQLVPTTHSCFGEMVNACFEMLFTHKLCCCCCLLLFLFLFFLFLFLFLLPVHVHMSISICPYVHMLPAHMSICPPHHACPVLWPRPPLPPGAHRVGSAPPVGPGRPQSRAVQSGFTRRPPGLRPHCPT